MYPCDTYVRCIDVIYRCYTQMRYIDVLHRLYISPQKITRKLKHFGITQLCQLLFFRNCIHGIMLAHRCFRIDLFLFVRVLWRSQMRPCQLPHSLYMFIHDLSCRVWVGNGEGKPAWCRSSLVGPSPFNLYCNVVSTFVLQAVCILLAGYQQAVCRSACRDASALAIKADDKMENS